MSVSAAVRYGKSGAASAGLMRSARLAQTNKNKTMLELRRLIAEIHKDTTLLKKVGGNLAMSASDTYDEIEIVQNSLQNAVLAMEQLRSVDKADPLLRPFKQYVDELSFKRETLANICNLKVKNESQLSQDTLMLVRADSKTRNQDYSINVETAKPIKPVSRAKAPPKPKAPTKQPASKTNTTLRKTVTKRVVAKSSTPTNSTPTAPQATIDTNMRASLRALGYSVSDVARMRPAEAQRIVDGGVQSSRPDKSSTSAPPPQPAPQPIRRTPPPASKARQKQLISKQMRRLRGHGKHYSNHPSLAFDMDEPEWTTYKASSIKGAMGNLVMNQFAKAYVKKNANDNGSFTNAMREVHKYREANKPKGNLAQRMMSYTKDSVIETGASKLGNNAIGDALRLLAMRTPNRVAAPESTEVNRHAYATSAAIAREIKDLDTEDSANDKWSMKFWPDFAIKLFDRLDKLEGTEKHIEGSSGGSHGLLHDLLGGVFGGFGAFEGVKYGLKGAYKGVKGGFRNARNAIRGGGGAEAVAADGAEAASTAATSATPEAATGAAEAATSAAPKAATGAAEAASTAARATPEAATGATGAAEAAEAATSAAPKAAAAAGAEASLGAKAAKVIAPVLENTGVLGRGISALSKIPGASKALSIGGRLIAPVVGALTPESSMGLVKGSATLSDRISSAGLALLSTPGNLLNMLRTTPGRRNSGVTQRSILHDQDVSTPDTLAKADDVVKDLMSGKQVNVNMIGKDLPFQDLIVRELLNFGDEVGDSVGSGYFSTPKAVASLPPELKWAGTKNGAEFLKQPGMADAFVNSVQDTVQYSRAAVDQYFASVQAGKPMNGNVVRALPNSVESISDKFRDWAKANGKKVDEPKKAAPPSLSKASGGGVAPTIVGGGIQLPASLQAIEKGYKTQQGMAPTLSEQQYNETSRAAGGSSAPFTNPNTMPGYTPPQSGGSGTSAMQPGTSAGDAGAIQAGMQGGVGAGGSGAGSGLSAPSGSGVSATPSGAGKNMGTSSSIPVEGRALLDTISGPESAGKYNVMYGGKTFDLKDGTQHPDQGAVITRGANAGQTSTAAGRYQFINSTWKAEQKKLGLKDFSPENQDKAAWDLAKTNYKARNKGRDLETDLKSKDPAMRANIAHSLSSTWTSLPGSQTGETGTSMNKFNATYDKQVAAYSQPTGPNATPSAMASASNPAGSPATPATASATATPATASASGSGTSGSDLMKTAGLGTPASASAGTPPSMVASADGSMAPAAANPNQIPGYDPYKYSAPTPVAANDAPMSPPPAKPQQQASMTGTGAPHIDEIPMSIDDDNMALLNIADFT
jgi:muramidase (phage lysozyme)